MVKIRKKDGTLEEFNPEKLERSLLEARTNSPAILEIVESLPPTDGTETAEISRRVIKQLRRLDPAAAARYEPARNA